MKKNVLLLGLILSICTSVFAEAPPVEQWVARYNNVGNSYDDARAIALDNQGNIYVAGASWSAAVNGDYATIKYDPAGNQLWVARYNGDANGEDFVFAMTVDDSGCAYVTGYSLGSSATFDYATIKYDPNGNQLWVARYDANDYDTAGAIATDSSGNVYVTGSSYGSGTDSDYATIKYSPAGNQLWVARYNGPANDYDGASAVAVDNSGNVYVTGVSQGSGSSWDYATIKYGPAGNQLWVVRYNGPANSYDSACALAVDNAGNVYVTGESIGIGTEDDYATIKYDTNGNQLWVARYNGPGNFYDDATAMALDNAGNVYVTGTSMCNGTIYDYATIKYSPDGSQLWLAYYNGPGNGNDKPYALAVDNLDNAYVTGFSHGSGTEEDYATVKYDPDGNQSWAMRYSGPVMGNRDDTAYAIAADNAGNVYITGRSYGSSSTGNDYATIKYTQHDYCMGPIAGDLNNDCKVNFVDYAILAQDWLIENYWDDLEILTGNWLECHYALQEDCW